jgi:hypothetical protein
MDCHLSYFINVGVRENTLALRKYTLKFYGVNGMIFATYSKMGQKKIIYIYICTHAEIYIQRIIMQL